MSKYIALLRGINVGGKNIIKMADLKTAFKRQGFRDVVTYINSGNVLFNSDMEEKAVKPLCEKLISESFSIDVPVFVISASDLVDALSHAPDWWNTTKDARHDAFFVIPPITAKEIVARIGEIKEEYESLGHYDRVIFWSAPIATFSRTRVSKIINDKSLYQAITVRNANTALKLSELAHSRHS